MRALTFSMALLTTALASIICAKPAPPPPPYLGVYQPQGVDEIGAWKVADEGERKLAASPIVLRDPALNAYVKSVLCAAVGADRCGAARIYILRTPVFNASMTPNGTMRIFSGLLLRVHNEAELATILGHEFGHFEKRHSLQEFKSRRGASDLLAWAAVLGSMSSSPRALADFNDLELSVYGSLFRFSRDQEREADALGVGYLNGSSLRPQAASIVWQNMIAEAQASSAARGLSKPKLDKIAFFASHPPEAERAATLAALASADGVGRDDGSMRYRQALSSWLPTFLDDQIKLNDFGGTDYIISALAETGWTAPLYRARGDLYRARGNPRDLVNAADFYSRAVALDPALPEAYRGLGLALIKTGRSTEGGTALQKYLQLKPDAADAGMIRLLAPQTEGSH